MVAVSAAWYAYREYSRTHKDLHTQRPDLLITAAALSAAFEEEETGAAAKFNDKIIEVDGMLQKLEEDEKGDYTVVLSGSSTASVRCLMDTLYRNDASMLGPGASVVVRGICTGFIRDDMGLGSDVILNRCVIIKRK